MRRADEKPLAKWNDPPSGHGALELRKLWDFSIAIGFLSSKLTKNYGKSPCLMGKLAMSMAKLLVYQGVMDFNGKSWAPTAPAPPIGCGHFATSPLMPIGTPRHPKRSMFCRKKGQDDVLPIQSEMIYLVAG